MGNQIMGRTVFLKEESGIETLEWLLILAVATGMLAVIFTIGKKVGSEEKIRKVLKCVGNGYTVPHTIPKK